jgi:hypothetical protein
MPANLSDLEQHNPNIRGQIEEWQKLRSSRGENPTDWEAFRQHATKIGAPDPGTDAPQEFMQAVGNAVGGVVEKLTGQQQGQRQQQQGQQSQKRGGGLLGRLFGGGNRK